MKMISHCLNILYLSNDVFLDNSDLYSRVTHDLDENETASSQLMNELTLYNVCELCIVDVDLPSQKNGGLGDKILSRADRDTPNSAEISFSHRSNKHESFSSFSCLIL